MSVTYINKLRINWIHFIVLVHCTYPKDALSVYEVSGLYKHVYLRSIEKKSSHNFY